MARDYGGFKPKLFFVSSSNARQQAFRIKTWFFPNWLRSIALRAIKKTHTPCVEFQESKWFYSLQYAHLLSINVRKPGWNK